MTPPRTSALDGHLDGTAQGGVVLVHELDSLRQGDLFRSAERAGRSQTDYVIAQTGALRSGLFIAGRIALSDTDLLDGIFFQLVGPNQLAALLGLTGRELPITVYGRGADLKESLAAMYELGDDMYWQTDQYLASLPGWDLERVRVSRDSWLDAAQSGRIAFVHPGTRPDDLASAKLGEPPVGGPQAQEWIAACRSTNRRSLIYLALEELEKKAYQSGYQHGLDYRETFLNWWNRAYLDGEADWFGVSWVTFDRYSLFPTSATVARVGAQRGKRLTVSGLIYELLVRVPPSMYADLYFLLERHRLKYWATRSVRYMNALAFGLVKLTEEPSLSRTRVTTFGKLAASLVGIVITVLSHYSLVVGDIAQLIVLLIVIGIALPYGELSSLVRLRRSELLSVLTIRDAND